MSTYTFETLNDKDFERLVRDLLQHEMGITFESFRPGKDSGIDLRYSRNSRKSIIVQAKHWSRTGLRKLLRHLEADELPKVRRLNPAQYILVTSLDLSPNNKAKVQKIFDPYIRNSANIYGLEDLNNLLGKFPEVEKDHYKLWLSSIEMLQAILHNAVSGRSQFVRETILHKSRLFVPCDNVPEAFEILNKQHVLLIKGQPGIGKTTLAEFLLYKLLGDGFELVAVEESFRDGEDAYKQDRRQVFYFDDFLGANYLEILHSRSSGSEITRFIDRVRQDKSKRLILTTRTMILNQAKEQYYNLTYGNTLRYEFELNISDYSKYDKARILYNHIYFSDLPSAYASQLFKNKNYMKIVDHENYSPRIIEFITSPQNISDVEPKKYLAFLLGHLNNPEKIWESAFENQVDDYSRFLLTSLFSLGDELRDETLLQIFEARLTYEINENGFARISNPFYSRVRLLLGGFINHQREDDSPGKYSFYNPAIADFLIGYFRKYPDEKWRILESAIFTEQFTTRFALMGKSLSLVQKNELPRYMELVLAMINKLKSGKGYADPIARLALLYRTFQPSEVGDQVVEIVRSLDVSSLHQGDFYAAVEIAPLLASDPKSKVELLAIWDSLIRRLFEMAGDIDQFKLLRACFDKCEVDYDEWISSSENKTDVQTYVDQFWDAEMELYLDQHEKLNNVYEIDDAKEALDDVLGEVTVLNEKLGIEGSPAFEEINDRDPEELVEENQERAAEEDYRSESWREHYFEERDEQQMIDDLFT